MYVVFFTSLLALYLTFRDSIYNMRGGTKYGFILITFIAAIHYNYGNDYMSYYTVFKNVTSTPFNWTSLMSKEIYREPGWALLCYIFKYLGGFFTMVAVLNIIQNYIYYKAITTYVPKQYWVYSVFIYLFTINFYVMNFSMMRQGFTVAVFMAMWPLLRDKKIWISLPLIFCLSFVHSSAKILYPFAFIGYLPQNKKVTTAIALAMAILWVLLFTNGALVEIFFTRILSISDMESYADTYSNANGGGTFGLGALIYLTPFFALLYFLFHDKEQSSEIRYFAIFALFSTVIAPFNHIIHIIGRVAIYFSTFSILSYPIAYSSITNKPIRYLLAGLIGTIIAYDYYLFFGGNGWEAFKDFHTIFEIIF